MSEAQAIEMLSGHQGSDRFTEGYRRMCAHHPDLVQALILTGETFYMGTTKASLPGSRELSLSWRTLRSSVGNRKRGPRQRDGAHRGRRRARAAHPRPPVRREGTIAPYLLLAWPVLRYGRRALGESPDPLSPIDPGGPAGARSPVRPYSGLKAVGLPCKTQAGSPFHTS